MSKNIAIIFAGGSGQRMGSGLPKQFIEVEGKPIIIHTLELFEEHNEIDAIYISCKEEYISKLEKMINRFLIKKVKTIVPGGSSGQDSIYNALKAAEKNEENSSVVLIHDGVRPFITEEVISQNIAKVGSEGSAITCSKFFETPIISTDARTIEDSPSRDNFYTAKAPQSFILGDILAAHEEIRKDTPNYEGIIDSCTLMRKMNKEVYMVESNRGNLKVTTPEDIYIFKAMLEYKNNQEALGLSINDVAKGLQNS